MATLTPQPVAVTGTELDLVAATASEGDKVPPGSTVIVRNGSGAPINVTFTVPGNTKYGVPNPDFVHAVPAGETTLFHDLPNDLVDPLDGLITFVCSAVADVTVGVVNV